MSPQKELSCKYVLLASKLCRFTDASLKKMLQLTYFRYIKIVRWNIILKSRNRPVCMSLADIMLSKILVVIAIIECVYNKAGKFTNEIPAYAWSWNDKARPNFPSTAPLGSNMCDEVSNFLSASSVSLMLSYYTRQKFCLGKGIRCVFSHHARRC
jgi:hypothetical protein